MDPADESKSQVADVCSEELLRAPSEVFRVDADAYREIEAALRKPATRRSALAELFARPRPD